MEKLQKDNEFLRTTPALLCPGLAWLLALSATGRNGVLFHREGPQPFSCGLSCPHGHPTSSTTEQGKKIAFSQSLSGRIRESNRVGLFFEIQPSFSIADLLTSSCEICEDHFPFVYRFGTSFWCAREYMSVYTGASVCYTLLFFYRI